MGGADDDDLETVVELHSPATYTASFWETVVG
jgi:hypothetical protein